MLVLGAPLGGILSLMDSVQQWVLAIFGIGLVIFVHELGHFLVAKRCGVRVEIFSLGFGPRLLGLRRGETDYRISLVPIGGYVKMAGDNPGEDVDEGDEGELPNKPIHQRAAIFSAGVAMNLVFALIVLPLVLAIGVLFNSTEIGAVRPGGAAWKAGLQQGDRVVRIGGNDAYDFSYMMADIALGDRTGIEIEFERDGELCSTIVVPEFDESFGHFMIGIYPSFDSLDVERGGPAAQSGMAGDEQVVAWNGEPLEDVAAFDLRRRENEDDKVVLTVRGQAGSERDVTVRPESMAEPRWVVGIYPVVDIVRAVRDAAARLPQFLRGGDRLVGLVPRVAGSTAPVLEPVRDADELSSALEKGLQAPGTLALRVDRQGEILDLPIPIGADPELVSDVALEQNIESCVVRLLPGYPAEAAGIPDGALIEKVAGVPVKSWDDIRREIEKAADEATVEPISVTGRFAGETFELAVLPREQQPLAHFGLLPLVSKVRHQERPLRAFSLGVSYAGYMIKNVYLTLKKIFVRDVSPKNLSGILTIAYVSKSLAKSGVASLFFFLAVVSLNLAFLNVLPIPLLDGGHLLFLLVEKVKGSPVSERVVGYSQLVGMVLVLALLLYVTYNDLLRLLAL